MKRIITALCSCEHHFIHLLEEILTVSLDKDVITEKFYVVYKPNCFTGVEKELQISVHRPNVLNVTNYIYHNIAIL